jgi:hypothetical protein
LAAHHFFRDSSNALRLRDIDFETQALQNVYSSQGTNEGSDSGGQVGATGQLAWHGDIDSLAT